MNILLVFWNVILWLMALQWITIRLGWYKFMCKDDPRNPVKTHINSLAEKHFSLETYFKVLTTGTNSVCIWNRYFLKTVLESISPSETTVLYQPGATFDKHYNSHFKPYNFVPPPDVKKVSVRVQYIYIIMYFYSYHLCL